MKSTKSDIIQIKNLGWLQGSLLSEKLIQKLINDKQLVQIADSKPIALVITHSCDVTNDSIEKEPYVELLIGSSAEKNPNYQHGKNPRTYQLDLEQSGTVDFSIHSRVTISREYLTIESPSGKVEERDLTRLKKWVARRYVRSAFPDAFNSRTQSMQQALHRILKNRGNKISGIYFDVVDDELLPSVNYEILAWVLMKTDDWEDSKVREAGQAVVDHIQLSLKNCNGIDLKGDVQFMPESKFSLDDYNELKRWDFDDLSLRDNQALDHLPNP